MNSKEVSEYHTLSQSQSSAYGWVGSNPTTSTIKNWNYFILRGKTMKLEVHTSASASLVGK